MFTAKDFVRWKPKALECGEHHRFWRRPVFAVSLRAAILAAVQSLRRLWLMVVEDAAVRGLMSADERR